MPGNFPRLSAKSAMSEAKFGVWQPIETAPRKGRPLPLGCPAGRLARDRNYEVRDLCDQVAIGFWLHGGWKSLEVEDCGTMGSEWTGWTADWVSIDLEPTHWMRLPTPPAENPSERAGTVGGTVACGLHNGPDSAEGD